MQALPIDRHVAALVDTVRRERALVVVAPPGSGKTTRIPPALAALGTTILLQPRRIAARALARRIADERAWTIGEEIGWQIRFERRFSSRTRLLVATEGVLTARLQSDPLLGDFNIVILDEFHERSIHADLALALVRQAAHSRDDLCVVVMSATLDAGAVARFLDFARRDDGVAAARVVDIDAQRHPVSLAYRPAVSMSTAAADALRDSDGHLLCFLPGAREIQRTADELMRLVPSDVRVLPLHGSLDVDAQERALAPSEHRKIILATNIAETSLTVDGVTTVIDSGLQRVLRFDSASAIDRLETERIAADSAEQRAGRAGRTAPGRAIRLWDEREILRAHREPEIRRVDLAAPVLDVIAWGEDPRAFEWFERPPEHQLGAALDLLAMIGATSIDSGNRVRLTPLGDELRAFPLHPRLARVVIAAGGAEQAVAIVTAISDNTRRARSRDAVAATVRSDAFALLDAARTTDLLRATREIATIARRILGEHFNAGASEETLLRAILAGYPDRVAMRRALGAPRLLLASGTGALLGRESGVHDGLFLVALELTASDRDQTTEATVRMASIVEREWLTPTAREIKHELDDEGRVRAIERVWYHALLLREQSAPPSAAMAAPLLARELRARIDARLRELDTTPIGTADNEPAPTAAPLAPTLDALLTRLHFAELDVDWDAILASATAGKNRIDAVDVVAHLPWAVTQKLSSLAPPAIVLPSGRDCRLEYRHDRSVVASAKLQELFGLAETPLIGPRRTPVTFALLAPNGRPVQITRDLRSFWNNGYAEVRKELRGRYPKHPWPDDPWSATPTHRAKPRPR